MTDHELDTFTHQQQTQRLFENFEQMITAFNTSNISAATGGVSVREFLEVARVVSLLRAQYLQRVVSLAEIDSLAELGKGQLQQIREDREAYEEALQGFGALRHALMRDYFKLNDDGDEINLTS